MSIGKNFDWMLGFSDDVRDSLDVNGNNSFPKTNIFLTKDKKTVLEFALAGYSKSDLKVETDNGALIISGDNTTQNKYEISHRILNQLTKRSFKRSYVMQKYATVDSVEFVDGILRIVIGIDIPEEKKPKTIPIK